MTPAVRGLFTGAKPQLDATLIVATHETGGEAEIGQRQKRPTFAEAIPIASQRIMKNKIAGSWTSCQRTKEVASERKSSM